MRDLGTRTFGSTKSKEKIPRKVLQIGVAVVLAVFIFLAIRSLLSEASGTGGGAVVLKDAPAGLEPVSVGDTNVGAGGVNLKTQSTHLSVVKAGAAASATATRSYGGGSYSLSVDATLPDPHAQTYQVWLVNSAGTVKDAGFMNGSKTSWSLTFRDTDKYSSYNTVWITYEITKEDGKPDQHILEGNF